MFEQYSRRLFFCVAAGAVIAAAFGVAAAPAQLGGVSGSGGALGGVGALTGFAPSVVRVEEDWSLLVNQPDPDVASPQVSTQMARSPDASRFANFHVNSCDIPTFSQGGLQLQTWRGDTNLSAQNSTDRSTMSAPDEMVTWTQYLDNTSGQIVFGISQGAYSQTWGDFGGISTTINGGSTNLDGYSSNYSIQNSGITFGANRVACMVLVAVRVYYSDGSRLTDNTPKVVYSAGS